MLHADAADTGFVAIGYVRPELRERGQALPMVIGMMLVFGITVATVMRLTLSNQRSSARTTDSAKAYNLAETGLNTAFSVLEQAANPSDPSAITATSTSLNGGTSSYRGTLSGTTWTLT